MSDRYDLFVAALAESNRIIVQMFLYALFAVVAYPIIQWTPAWMRRPLEYAYLAALLFAFLLVTVFSSSS